MHKDEASQGFTILSNPTRVKIAKFLYINNQLSYDELLMITAEDEVELNKHLKLMIEGNLISKQDNDYFINRDYVDSLLDFIRTPCGCCHR